MAQIDRIWSRILHLGGHHMLNAFFILYMHFVDILGFQKGFICSYNGLLGPPWGAPKVQKWVNDTYIANFGQLDHYVVFGTKFGAVQDFQRGKMCPIGIQQTHLTPP